MGACPRLTQWLESHAGRTKVRLHNLPTEGLESMRDLLTQLRQQRLRKGHLRSKLDAAQVQVDGLLAYRGNAATLRRRLDFIPSSKLDHMMEVTMLVDKVYDSTAATWLGQPMRSSTCATASSRARVVIHPACHLCSWEGPMVCVSHLI